MNVSLKLVKKELLIKFINKVLTLTSNEDVLFIIAPLELLEKHWH